MSSSFKLKKNKTLENTITQDFNIEVGITSSANVMHPMSSEDGGHINLATLQAIHHFGSVKKNIPATDAYINPTIRDKQNIFNTVLSKIKSIKTITPRMLAKILGEAHVKNIQDTFYNQSYGTWAKLKPKTIAKKINNNPLRLINTHTLLNAQSFDILQSKNKKNV